MTIPAGHAPLPTCGTDSVAPRSDRFPRSRRNTTLNLTVDGDMDLASALDFARTTRRSVMATPRRDGRSQLSNVFHQVSDDGVILVSTTAARAKYRNLARDPWAALHVTQDDFWAYVVLEGTVELTPIITTLEDPGVEAQVAHYRAVVGENDDWDAFRASLVAERRSMIRLVPSRAYGMADLSAPDEG